MPQLEIHLPLNMQRESHNSIGTTLSPCSDAEHVCVGVSGPIKTAPTDISHDKATQCPDCGGEIPKSSEHIFNALVLTEDVNTDSWAEAFLPNDELLNDEKSGPPPHQTQTQLFKADYWSQSQRKVTIQNYLKAHLLLLCKQSHLEGSLSVKKTIQVSITT
jgi:hypothetical protein